MRIKIKANVTELKTFLKDGDCKMLTSLQEVNQYKRLKITESTYTCLIQNEG